MIVSKTFKVIKVFLKLRNGCETSWESWYSVLLWSRARCFLSRQTKAEEFYGNEPTCHRGGRQCMKHWKQSISVCHSSPFPHSFLFLSSNFRFLQSCLSSLLEMG